MAKTGSGFLVLIMAALLALLVLLAVNNLPKDLPRIQDIQPRAHAVERHGADAEVAREVLHKCGNSLRTCLGRPKEEYGLTVVLWCETGLSLCPGAYATVGGIEKTCFIRPCVEWPLECVGVEGSR